MSFPQQDILARIRRRRVFEPSPNMTPPIALEEEAAHGRTDPWSERLPDGRTVNEAIMETLGRSGGAGIPQQAQQRAQAPMVSGATPTVPPGIDLAGGQETRPWKVGSGAGEIDPLRREAARIRSMIENPTSKVLPGGQVEPPRPMGRGKAALLGALYGAGMGGQQGSLAGALSGAATGAGIGLVHPRSIQEWRRRMEVQDAQGQLAQQQKLGLGQAQLESEQAEARQRQMAPEIALMRAEQQAAYDRERIRIQREVAEGRMSVAEGTRQIREKELELRKAEAEERKRHNLATEDISRTRPASSAQAAQAAEGEAIAEATTEALKTLKTETDREKGQLLENERAIKAKESWWRSEAIRRRAEALKAAPDDTPKLEEFINEVKAEDPSFTSGEYDQLISNTEALRKKLPESEKQLRSMEEDIRKGRAKGARAGTRGGGRGKYAGQRIARSRLAEAAKRLGKTVEETERLLVAEGAVIY